MAREIIELDAADVRGRKFGRGDGEGTLVPDEDGGWTLQVGHAHDDAFWVHVRLTPEVIRRLAAQ